MGILSKIVKKTKERVQDRKAKVALHEIKSMIGDAIKPMDFSTSIKKHPDEAIKLVAEIKKSSPSKGIIRTDFDHLSIARIYEKKEVSAVSVLTEEDFFHGNLLFIPAVRKVLTKLDADTKATAKAKKEPDTTVYDINIGSSPVLGPKDAPVTIVEFVDLQCPYCVREYPKIKRVLKKYPDEVRVVFKHYPLGFHKQAKGAHAAVELAKLEGGNEAFWKMHDMIMAHPKNLEISDLRGYAESLDLDMAKFDEVVSDPKKIDQLLAVDLAEAKKCKVTGTPTVMINGLKMDGRSLQAYDTRIDEILEKAKKAVATDTK